MKEDDLKQRIEAQEMVLATFAKEFKRALSTINTHILAIEKVVLRLIGNVEDVEEKEAFEILSKELKKQKEVVNKSYEDFLGKMKIEGVDNIKNLQSWIEEKDEKK